MFNNQVFSFDVSIWQRIIDKRIILIFWGLEIILWWWIYWSHVPWFRRIDNLPSFWSNHSFRWHYWLWCSCHYRLWWLSFKMFWGYSWNPWRALLLGPILLLLAPLRKALEENLGFGWLLLLWEWIPLMMSRQGTSHLRLVQKSIIGVPWQRLILEWGSWPVTLPLHQEVDGHHLLYWLLIDAHYAVIEVIFLFYCWNRGHLDNSSFQTWPQWNCIVLINSFPLDLSLIEVHHPWCVIRNLWVLCFEVFHLMLLNRLLFTQRGNVNYKFRFFVFIYLWRNIFRFLLLL